MYRQGDVFLKPISGVKTDGLPVRKSGIVAYGEATGHAHKFIGEATVFEAEADRLLVSVTGTAELVHEEHATIKPAPGLYEVIGQREYTAGDVRKVLD